MSGRSCIVVSIVPFAPVDAAEIIEQIALIISVDCQELDLQWHETVFKNPDQLALDSDDFDEEDRAVPRFISTCSVLADAWLRLGEDFLLTAISSCSYKSKKLSQKCEVWMTAPCLIPLFTKTMEDLIVRGDEERGIQTMKEFGVVIIRNAVDQGLINSLRTAAYNRIENAQQAVAEKRPDLQLGTDLFAFVEFSSRGGQRFDLLFSEDDPASAPIFRVAKCGAWVPIVRGMLGDDFRCMASVVYSRPGADAQDWHTDGAHIGPSAGWDGAGAPPPYALCVFLALIDLDPTVGFTQFWPGTHRHAGLAGFGRAAPLLGCAVDGVVAAGGCVVYDYRLMHRGMPNRSAGTQRPLIQLLYHHPSYRETKNYGQAALFGSSTGGRAGPALCT
jgi:ectoine hydroxylase-related dioxygenase (phytanoyl-CoA dioxygenase family)